MRPYFAPRTVARLVALTMVCANAVRAEVEVARETVPGQPLGANVRRLISAMDYLGAPLPGPLVQRLEKAIGDRDADAIQNHLDPHVLTVVSLNPEVRVKVARGPAAANIQQGGFTPVLVKVINKSTVTRQLRVFSPQSGPVYSGAADLSLKRQAQTELIENQNSDGSTDRFLQIEMFDVQPMTRQLSGLEVEYAIALIYASESGRLEATLGFDVGAGTQDIGFRGEVPILFHASPAIPVTVRISDFDGTPTVARLEFRDRFGRVFPPQAKRLAPDFFFQPQIYRVDGQEVLLPPGQFTVTYSRGPEYKRLQRTVTISGHKPRPELSLRLERWVNPADFGYYSGDHHIHGAGCAHYDNPTQGASPSDMFAQVKGEGLNVGCVLTWGPCFDFQRQYFSPQADEVSDAFTVLKYDLEISGFGSAALGHVCLLNLKDQTYPGSEGTSIKGWPTWTVPVMRWAKQQGGVTGYPHSAMHVNPSSGATRLMAQTDRDADGALSQEESTSGLMPEPFESIDEDGDGQLTLRELTQSIDRAADRLPNLTVPEMNGVGAMEICVSTAEGVCDFISAMDTARVSEWNTWYHLLNCGFPLKLSGETDFPCMSSRRVGQGRVYVRLGDIERVDFHRWCQGIQLGQSYVSDGFAHALDFRVNDVLPGTEAVQLDQPSSVNVTAKVAFAPEQPKAVAYGGITPAAGRRWVGDTVVLHAPRSGQRVEGGDRVVELVVNGESVDDRVVPADGKVHALSWDVVIPASSWVAVRQFPQLHTNPVDVLVNQRPIRASRDSARWCAATIDLLWNNRQNHIAQPERGAAKEAYDRAIARFRAIADESQ